MNVHSLTEARKKKTEKKAAKDCKIDDIIKTMVLGYHNIDRKLEELSEICLGKKDEQKKT